MKNKLPDGFLWWAGEFDNSLYQFFLMSEERFTIKDIGVSYTELNYWDKKELLRSERSNESQWRKFNFFDIVWLNIIRELREFGIKTEHIKYFKEVLFTPIEVSGLKNHAETFLKSGIDSIDESLRIAMTEALQSVIDGKTRKDDTLSYFEQWLTYCLVKRIPASLLFFDSGEVCCWLENSEKENPLDTRLLKAKHSHISIPINKMISQLVEENLILLHLPDFGIISEQEAGLLEMINLRKYKSITITFKGNQPEFVIAKKATSSDIRTISDAIRESSYQSVKVEVNNGKVVFIENDQKIPYNNLGKHKK